MASTRINSNAMLIVMMLQKLKELLTVYCRSQPLTEYAIRNNFIVIYELIDEVFDFGFPQILEIDVLKKYITSSGGNKLDKIGPRELRQLTVQATGATAWRAQSIKYRKNEIYLDIVEHVNIQVSRQGQLLTSDVMGKIIVKCQLSGVPECKFGTNDKLGPQTSAVAATPNGISANFSSVSHFNTGEVVLDDLRFHQCVRMVPPVDLNKTITFIPPDGTFELLTYRATENIRLPFQLFPTIVERGKNRVEYSIKLKSTYPKSGVATHIIVNIPCPKTAARAVTTTPCYGRAKFEPLSHAIVWRIKRFPGLAQTILRATVDLATSVDETPWVRPPICLDFQVPMFTASGLRVRFLRVYEKSNYKTIKWVRYVTRAGHYQYRI